MNILNELKGRKEYLEKLKADAEKRLTKLRYKGYPKYCLHVYSQKNQVFVRRTDVEEKEKYLSGNKRYIAEEIAMFDYLNKTIRKIDAELKHVNSLIKLSEKGRPESVYESLCDGRQKLVTPIRKTDAQFVQDWLSQPYIGKEFDEDVSEFYTDKNERVRSKSEILIANALAKNGVPYKYECPLTLKGLGLIYPDFTVLNVKRRKVMYWEHLGKMDDVDYVRKNTFRINCYEKNGYFHGDSLITTRETSTLPIDLKLVDQIIKHYFID